MDKIKVLFDADGSEKEGSYRIPFIGLRNKLTCHQDVVVVDRNNIAESNIVICKGGQGKAQHYRTNYKNKYIVLAKPHYERGLSVNIFYRPISSIKSFITYVLRLFFKDRKKESYLEDIKNSDCVIADSKRLMSYFNAQGIRSYYMRLVEDIEILSKPLDLPQKGEEFIFTYHGSITHYNESYDQLVSIIQELNNSYNVVFYCVSNLKEIKRKVAIKGVDAVYVEYDISVLADILSKTNLGFVPNIIYPLKYIPKSILSLLVFGGFQPNLDIYAEKLSVNAGRAYVYANYGIPFIAHPNQEIVSEFSHVAEIEFPGSSAEVVFYLKSILLDKEKYNNISTALLTLANNSYNIRSEANKFVEFLKSEISTK